MVIALLLSCSDGGGTLDTAAPADFVPMEADEWLIRLSLDLRQRRPAPEELTAVREDPSLVDGYLDAWLHSAEFADVVEDLFAEIYRTRTEDYYSAEEVGLTEELGWQWAIGEEPLKILGRVADEDRPWTEIVTGDWILADDQLAQVLDLDVDSVPADDWVEARYLDGRPAAGVLGTTAFWWRYGSNIANANRHRANNVARILLCEDFLQRPVEVDVSDVVALGGDVEDAITEDPACMACHASLDPLASYFWGFFFYSEGTLVETLTYHPAREQLWRERSGTAPGWYGQPGTSLADLGPKIAADPRFPVCTVEQVASELWQRPTDNDDQDELDGLREVFLNEGLTLRPLIKATMEGERYASTGELGTVKMLTPAQLSGTITAITDFTWTYQGYDMLLFTQIGWQVMAGGSDGLNVLESTHVPTPTVPLMVERLAEAAAWNVVQSDAKIREELNGDGSGTQMFQHVVFREADDTEATIRDEIVNLWWRVLAEEIDPDGPEADGLYELYGALFELLGSEREAWVSVLAALLREPELMFY